MPERNWHQHRHQQQQQATATATATATAIAKALQKTPQQTSLQLHTTNRYSNCYD